MSMSFLNEHGKVVKVSLMFLASLVPTLDCDLVRFHLYLEEKY